MVINKIYYLVNVALLALIFITPSDASEHNLSVIQFGGIEWTVREAGNGSPPVQPGNNYFSASYGKEESIYIDGKGRLHLSIVSRNGIWYSAEVKSVPKVAAGTYRFRVELPNDPPLDPRVAVAIFLYESEVREFDIEISKFLSQFDCSLIDCDSCVSKCQDCQIQFVRQPYCEAKNWQRFVWPFSIRESIHEIYFSQTGEVRLTSRADTNPDDYLITHTFSNNAEIAESHDLHLHLSVWLMDESGLLQLNYPDSRFRQEVIFEILEMPAGFIPVETQSFKLYDTSRND